MILSSSKFHHHLHFRGCLHQQRARCMVHDPQSTVSEGAGHVHLCLFHAYCFLSLSLSNLSRQSQSHRDKKDEKERTCQKENIK